MTPIIPWLPLLLFTEKDHTTVQAKTCTVVPLFFDGSLKPPRKAGKSASRGAGIRVALSENNPLTHGAVSRRCVLDISGAGHFIAAHVKKLDNF